MFIKDFKLLQKAGQSDSQPVGYLSRLISWWVWLDSYMCWTAQHLGINRHIDQLSRTDENTISKEEFVEFLKDNSSAEKQYWTVV